MRIPATASPDVQQAFKDVWSALDPWSNTNDVVDFKGRRISRAGGAIDPFDYTTLHDVKGLIAAIDIPTPKTPKLPDLLRYGTHDERIALAPLGVPDGTLFWETDRLALYQLEKDTPAGGIGWVHILTQPIRDLLSGLPGDLDVNDAGFRYFVKDGGYVLRWSGGAWNYHTGTFRSTFSAQPAIAVADAGFEFIATDRGNHVWRSNNSNWILQEGAGGPMADLWANRPTLTANDTGFRFEVTDRGSAIYRWTGTVWVWESQSFPMPVTLSPDTKPTLTANDVGFQIHSTDFNRPYVWNGSAWIDGPMAAARHQIMMFGATPVPIAGWALCDGSTVTRSQNNGGTTSITLPDLITTPTFLRGNGSAGGTGGAATHTHGIDPPSTTTGTPSAVVSGLQTGGTTNAATNSHTHDVDIAAFTSDSASSLPPYYNGLPYYRL